MELTKRQEKILNSLVREYIGLAEPVSSHLLKKRCGLDVSPATIRNELQELTGQGYVKQPHISAGRVPTEKAYKYFIEITFGHDENVFSDFIFREIETAKQKIEKELKLAQELTKSLTEISSTLTYTRLQDKDTIFEILKIIGPSQASYDKNINVMRELLNEFEDFL